MFGLKAPCSFLCVIFIRKALHVHVCSFLKRHVCIKASCSFLRRILRRHVHSSGAMFIPQAPCSFF